MAGAFVLRAAAFRPGIPPAPPEAILAGPEPGVRLLVLRLAAVLGGSIAALLAARAAARLGGRMAGLGAGWLLALTAFAVRNGTWGGAPAVLMLAGAGALLFVVRWRESGGIVDLAGLGLWVLIAFGGLRLAPLTNLASPDILSPLGAGLLQTGRIAGPVAAVLALLGVAVAVRTRARGARAVAVATGLIVLLVLLREGADPNSLAAVLPGIAILAGYAAARLGEAAPALPGAGRIALGIALLAALAGSARAIVAARGASPARDTAQWILAKMPEGLPVLIDEPGLELPIAKPGIRGFQPVHIPPDGVTGDEAALFYNPELARHFPILALRDPVPADGPVQRDFWKFFHDEWHDGHRAGQGEYPLDPVTVFARPNDWKPDSVRIAEMRARLDEAPFRAIRDTSRAYADWIVAVAKAMRASGDLDGAQDFLDLAQARGDWRAEVFFEQGLVQLLREQYDAARSSMLDALDRDPHHGGAHYNLGTLLEREGDLDGAETEYRAAVVNLADPLPAHVRLGELLARRGRLDEARAELGVVRKLRPGSQEQAELEQAIRDAGGG